MTKNWTVYNERKKKIPGKKILYYGVDRFIFSTVEFNRTLTSFHLKMFRHFRVSVPEPTGGTRP